MAGRRKAVGNPKVAVAYLRVSTEDQNLGPEAQKAAIEAWAARQGARIAAWHEDHGVSGGAKITDRPQLLAALGALREHGAGVLVVAKRDRLARDVTAARAIADLAGKAGAFVRSADGASDGEGPEALMMRTIIDTFAEYERGLIGARTKVALAAKKARGEAIGPPPYGYRKGEKGVLHPEEGEQAVLARVLRLMRDDAPERHIAELLNETGARSRAGTPFTQTQIHRMIERLRAQHGGWSNARLVQREITPLEGATIDVDLYAVLIPFGDNIRAKRSCVEPLLDAIEAERVSLRVVSLKHRLPEGWEDRAPRLRDDASGQSPEHRNLCALSYLWLEKLGRKPRMAGVVLNYSGGIADVGVEGRSVFVECGSIREDKVLLAMRAGEKVVVVPYGLGGRSTVEGPLAFIFSPKRGAVGEDPERKKDEEIAASLDAHIFGR